MNRCLLAYFFHIHWVLLRKLHTVITWVLNSWGRRSRKDGFGLLWQEQFDPCRNAERAASGLGRNDSGGNWWTSPCCRASLLLQNEHPVCRHPTTAQRTWSQDPEKYHCVYGVGGESSCLSVSISRFLEGQPKYFEQLLAQTPGLCGICNNLIPHNNNPSYILLFYGMYAWLPFLSKGIL